MKNDWLEFLRQQGVTVRASAPSRVRGYELEKDQVAEQDFLCDLSDQSWVLVDGPDAQSFLQAQFTNDLAGLTPQVWQLSGYCNPQGRLLCLLRICRYGKGFLLQLPADLALPVIDRLRRYILRSKVSMAVSGEIASFALSGTPARALLDDMEPISPEAGFACYRRDDMLVWRHPGAVERCQLIGPAATLRSSWQQADTAVVGGWAWQWQEIINGVPVITQRTSEQFVPQMVNLDLVGGVSFSKGCYPGQEIVARMRYLGRLKQRMIRGFAAGGPPIPGAKLCRAGDRQTVGQVVVAQPSPLRDGSELLAVVKLSALGAAIEVGAAEGTPLERLELPYPLESADQRQA